MRHTLVVILFLVLEFINCFKIFYVDNASPVSYGKMLFYYFDGFPVVNEKYITAVLI